MAHVSFDGLTKRFGTNTVLDGLSAEVRDQSFTVITGPPASGKSLIFRLLVGLETPTAGSIRVNGTDVVGLKPGKRPVSYVPQSFALFPHLTVYDNIAYPLTLARANRREIDTRVRESAETLSITPLLSKTPDTLSGGEKQRVAVARGLSQRADVFVLDDPLVGLDFKLRERLMDDLKRLRADLGATFLYATSDPLEALIMAEDLAVLAEGQVLQMADVETVYREPTHLRAMQLVGFPRANLLEGWVIGKVVKFGPIRLTSETPIADGTAVTVGLRTEALTLNGTSDPAITVPATVSLVEDLGSDLVVYLDADGLALTMSLEATGDPPPPIGTALDVSFRPQDAILFDTTTGRRLCRGSA